MAAMPSAPKRQIPLSEKIEIAINVFPRILWLAFCAVVFFASLRLLGCI